MKFALMIPLLLLSGSVFADDGHSLDGWFRCESADKSVKYDLISYGGADEGEGLKVGSTSFKASGFRGFLSFTVNFFDRNDDVKLADVLPVDLRLLVPERSRSLRTEVKGTASRIRFQTDDRSMVADFEYVSSGKLQKDKNETHFKIVHHLKMMILSEDLQKILPGKSSSKTFTEIDLKCEDVRYENPAG